ncbi:hypothetical protein HMPREF0083_01977 [Aneurinibacillus aneurinilyticus ATCC 12856]|uniref:Uncharacterized protein n=1 Tax=Aneurinibacillus aneurinilyticus ATCC 12856 TaxID=649747 RepID=U1X4P2_ANEAE|nr:hypothetical protein HMPREF0083_01977 [Aneurinibacillus aneurinilyticus ATCC 12856]
MKITLFASPLLIVQIGKDEGTRRRVHLTSSDIWIINRCDKNS